MSKEPVVVIGIASVRDSLFEEWAKTQDPWSLRRDFERVDARTLEDVPREIILQAKVILGNKAQLATEVPDLHDNPWQDHLTLVQNYPHAPERLRIMRLLHLQNGWPSKHLPTRADNPARVLGYLLKSKNWK